MPPPLSPTHTNNLMPRRRAAALPRMTGRNPMMSRDGKLSIIFALSR